MNLIIRGINMPKNGEMAIAFASDENGEITLALIIDAKGKPIEHKGVTEIPTPHGRLIDADELYNKFKNEYCNRNCDSSVQGKICDHCGVPRALNIILNAPTIIKAEVPE